MNSKLLRPEDAHHHYGNIAAKRFRSRTLTIEGFSRSAVYTSWKVSEMKLIFDMGACCWDFAAMPFLAITHGHLDHIAGLPQYIVTRLMMGLEPPTIFIPDSYFEPIQKWLQAAGRVSQDEFNYELIACKPGDRISFYRDFILAPFATSHTVPSQGYVVFQSREKLLEKFSEASGDELADLRQQGTSLTETTLVPLLAISGDTRLKSMLTEENEVVRQAEVLVMEATFLDNDVTIEQAEQYGHIHLDELVKQADRFHNAHIILAHFSASYDEAKIVSSLQEKISNSWEKRLVGWI